MSGSITKLKCFFHIGGQVALCEKMEATMVTLKCDALRWFQWWESCNLNSGWEKFKGINGEISTCVYE